MNLKGVNPDTYKDLALSIVAKVPWYRECHYSSAHGSVVKQSSISPKELETEWKTRIVQWQQKFLTRRETIRPQDKLEDIQFGDFFLQYPAAATYYSNILQQFFEFDQLVSEDSNNKIPHWDSRCILEYLRARKVDPQAIRRKLEAGDKTEEWKDNPQAIRRRLEAGDEAKVFVFQLNLHIDSLEAAWEMLPRAFAEHLKDFEHATLLQDEIGEAVKEQLALVCKSMRTRPRQGKQVTSNGSEIGDKAHPQCTSTLITTHRSLDPDSLYTADDKKPPTTDITLNLQHRGFEPLSRTPSFEVIKKYGMLVLPTTRFPRLSLEQQYQYGYSPKMEKQPLEP